MRIRWMIRRDLEEVLAIENVSFPYPWGEDEFLGRLRQRNCIGMVAEGQGEGNPVIGYMMYELHETRLHLLTLASSPRREGIGRKMVAYLANKLHERRSRITTMVSEDNLDAQLFFRSMGFRATGVIRDAYDVPDLAAYKMLYKHRVVVAT